MTLNSTIRPDGEPERTTTSPDGSNLLDDMTMLCRASSTLKIKKKITLLYVSYGF